MSVDFERLARLQPEYEDNFVAKRKLAGKVLTMILGPTGAGKSTIIRTVEQFQAGRSDETWGEPGSLVTRDLRPDDPDSYVTLTHDQIVRRIDEQSVTNYSVHPSGNIYATGPEQFTYDFNLLPTMTSSIRSLTRAGFDRTHAVFVTVEPHDLKTGLSQRETDPAYPSRLKESIGNVEYALDNAADINFVRNSHLPGGLEMAADDVIAVTCETYDRDKTPELHVAHAMWSYLHKQQRDL